MSEILGLTFPLKQTKNIKEYVTTHGLRKIKNEKCSKPHKSKHHNKYSNGHKSFSSRSESSDERYNYNGYPKKSKSGNGRKNKLSWFPE